MQATTPFTYKTIAEDKGRRLDALLAARPEIASRSFGERLIKNMMVLVDGKVAPKSYRLSASQTIEYRVPDPKEAEVAPQNIPIEIIYEDHDLAVINKEAGLVVHPSYGHWEGTLVNALLFHLKDLSGIGGVKRPGIVHRLDKNTSGLMLVAKNDETHLALSEAIKKREVKREYKALVYGTFKEEEFVVEAPISRHPVKRQKMSVQAGGRFAKTEFSVLERFKDFTLLKAKLITGRTHQIRVHLSYISHPIVGDEVYGKKENVLGLKRPFLHAFRLSFTYPKTGNQMQFESDLPIELKTALRRVRGTRPT